MKDEPKLIELFESLLGDKYKIVPISESDIVDTNDSKDKFSGLQSPDSHTGDVVDIGEDDTADILIEGTDSDVLKNSEDDDDVDANISDEAKALFERDKRLYGISVPQNDSSSVNAKTNPLIKEAQEIYDRVVKNLDGLINTLRESKGKASDLYKSILSDMEDPYREQLAAPYAPHSLSEQVDYFLKIRQDPFYGRIKLSSVDGKIIDVYIGRVAYNDYGAGIKIVSPWGEIGGAFRRHTDSVYIDGKYYMVLNKYTYLINNGRIIDVKDESPR